MSFDKKKFFSRFDNFPVYETIPGTKYKRLVEDLGFFYRPRPYGPRIKASKGLITDGASIPKIFWFFLGSPFDGHYDAGAITHDDLYQKVGWFDCKYVGLAMLQGKHDVLVFYPGEQSADEIISKIITDDNFDKKIVAFCWKKGGCSVRLPRPRCDWCLQKGAEAQGYNPIKNKVMKMGVTIGGGTPWQRYKKKWILIGEHPIKKIEDFFKQHREKRFLKKLL